MKAIVWNMRSKNASLNWRKVVPGAELACDIALLNEATPRESTEELHVLMENQTIGRDDMTHGGKKTRKWATAVASTWPLKKPDDVWTLSSKHRDRRSELTVSRPGSWTVGVVSFPNGESVTAISIYGLLDERADASVHRSLSDLTRCSRTPGTTSSSCWAVTSIPWPTAPPAATPSQGIRASWSASPSLSGSRTFCNASSEVSNPPEGASKAALAASETAVSTPGPSGWPAGPRSPIRTITCSRPPGSRPDSTIASRSNSPTDGRATMSQSSQRSGGSGRSSSWVRS